MNYGYYNGEYAVLEELKIPALDRTVYFGDGVYDVTTLVNGGFFAMDYHLERFFNSCRSIDIPAPCGGEELCGILHKLVELSKPEGDALLYWQASRGTGMRSHSYPDGMKPNLFAYIKPLKRSDVYEPVKLISAEDIRFEMCDIKTLNLLPNVLTSKKAADAGCYEAVLHRGQTVTEGTHTSITIIKGGALIVPPLSKYILPSVTRRILLELCEKHGFPYEIRDFTLEELKAADEVLVGSATTLIRPASLLDGQPIGGKDGETYNRLAFAFLKLYIG